MAKPYEDKITVERLTTHLKIPYSVAESLIEKSCELGVLTKRYALRCPDCELTLRLAGELELEEVLNEVTHCYGCELGSENLDLKLVNENILNIYKINR